MFADSPLYYVFALFSQMTLILKIASNLQANCSCGIQCFGVVCGFSVFIVKCVGSRHPPPTLCRHPHLPGQTPPPEMAIAADGTHPSGMHSCYWCTHIQSLELSVLSVDDTGENGQ